MSEKRYFSVIIPCHNEEEYIEHCLESLERQTISPNDFEVIVIDSASTDRTMEVVKRYQQTSLLHIVIANVPHRGVSLARNRGAALSQGALLVFLDADNTPHPDLLSDIQRGGRQAGVIKTLPNVSSVFGMGVFLVLDLFKRIGPRPFGKNYCTREIFTAIGGYQDGIALGENVEFLLRVKKWMKMSKQKLKYISTPVYCSMRRFSHQGYTKVLLQWWRGYIGYYGSDYEVIR